ncbi:MAG: hypothetical protein KAJ32_00790 [Gammaproteobacteria bacterium]|nr:hypothetical protein [Gammaproteobacteria bacterium]
MNRLTKLFLTSLTLLVLSACFGGGGSSSTTSVQPLVYVGKTDPADITLTNTPTLLVNVLYGGETSSGVPTGVTVSTTGNAVAITNRLVVLLNYSMDNFIGDSSSGYYFPQGVVIDETIGCYTGYYTLKGTLNDYTGAGTLAINYVDCVLDGTAYNGSGTMTFYYIDIYTGNASASIDFVLLTISGSDFRGSMSGIISIEDYFYGNELTETIQLNIVAKDDVLNKMYKFDGYTMTFIINDIYAYNSSATIGYGGVIYDSIHGGISIENYSPLTFSSYLNTEPDGGGPVKMIGNNSSMQLTVESGRHALLELDLDGNGSYEVIRYILWQELDEHSNLDLTDSDGDGMHDSWETMYGLDLNSGDAGDNLDGDGLTNLQEYLQGYDPSDALSPTL